MERSPQLVFILTLVITCAMLFCQSECKEKQKPKKDPRDYTDMDLEKLYDEWEENDEDELEDDEKPLHKRPPPKAPNLEEVMKQASSPEELLKITKKGQSVIMFVGIGDVDGKPATKKYTEKWTSLWQSSLFNNHIDVQVFLIEDNRAIFMFLDGSKAWEAKDFLLKQEQVRVVSLEGREYDGPAKGKSSEKVEL